MTARPLTEAEAEAAADAIRPAWLHEVPHGHEWIQDFRMDLGDERSILVRNQPCAGTSWWYWLSRKGRTVNHGTGQTADAAKEAAVSYARLIGWLK